MAADVEEFIRDRKLGSATLIGHSMGAKAAMVLALRKPHLVDRLIAVDNSPIGTPLSDDFEQYVKAMIDIQGQRVTSRAKADALLAKYEPNTSIRQFLLTNLIKSETGGMTFRVPVDTLGNALVDLGAFPYSPDENIAYNKPTLFIRGTQSRYITERKLKVVEHFFPNYELASIDAGHWVQAENPAAFLESVYAGNFIYLVLIGT